MDWIHKLLNIIFPIFAIIIIPIFLPPFLVYNLLSYSIKTLFPARNLAGKVVLITGASSGVGEHLAYEYARRGARLALAARREDRLRSVAAKSTDMGSPEVIVIRADVSKVEDCKRLVEETMSHFGQLDYLVNNAGATEIRLFEDSTTEFSTLRSIIDINFWGSVYCTKFAIPHLRNNKGKIIAISSTATWLATPRLAVYNASKAAQFCFFETLKAEFVSDIGITIVTPGLIVSEMTGDESLSQARVNKGIPVKSATSCAKAIVESALRGDLYLTEPSWWRVGFWFKQLFPQLMANCLHFWLVNRPWTNSNKDS